MSPKIFTFREREEVKVKLMEKGFELIKEHGMVHASVQKITHATGIGKSTFYNFFSSKEMFVYDIICYQRDRAKQHFIDLLQGRDKITTNEAKEYLKHIILSDNSIYKYLTAEDKEKLKAVLPSECYIPSKDEAEVMDSLFKHMEGVREDIDYKIVANLIKIMALAMIHQNELHQDALEATIHQMYNVLFTNIFNENN